MILVGDLGGTNARLALFDPPSKRPIRSNIFSSSRYESVEAVAAEFLGKKPPRIDAAVLGIAGPVVNGRCATTNLPWVIDSRDLSRALRIPSVTLLNDLVALAFGALTVRADRLRLVQGEKPPKKTGGNLAVIAAGTGLGEAALIWDGEKHVPLATEGGHVDFAPRDSIEFELLEYLKVQLQGRVSCERIVSGRGIGTLYDFFVDAKGMRESTENTQAIANAPDRNSAIVKLGTGGESVVAARAVGLFLSLYGAETGNFALKTFSLSGVYIAGGIAVGLVDAIANPAGRFLDAFRAKGRMMPLLAGMPVAIDLDSDIGLAGCAYYASRRL